MTDGVGDFNGDSSTVSDPMCEAVVASCSSVVLNDVLEAHYYSFQAWKIGARATRVTRMLVGP